MRKPHKVATIPALALVLQVSLSSAFQLGFPTLNSVSGASSITWDPETSSCSTLTIQHRCSSDKYVTGKTSVSSKRRTMTVPVDWLERFIKSGNTHCQVVAQCEDGYPNVFTLASVNVYLGSDSSGRPTFSSSDSGTSNGGGGGDSSSSSSKTDIASAPTTTPVASTGAAALTTSNPSTPVSPTSPGVIVSTPVSATSTSGNAPALASATGTTTDPSQTTNATASATAGVSGTTHISMGPIIGGAVGGLVALLAVAFLLFCWRRRARKVASPEKKYSLIDKPDPVPLPPVPFVPSPPSSPSASSALTSTRPGERYQTDPETVSPKARMRVVGYTPSELRSSISSLQPSSSGRTDGGEKEVMRLQIMQLSERVMQLEASVGDSQLENAPPRYSSAA